MNKKGLLIIVLFVFISVALLFAQQVERITFTELRTDGSVGRTRTVDAVLVGWIQEEHSMQGNFKVTYQTSRLVDGEWTDWELSERQPMSISLRQQFDMLQRAYNTHTNIGMIFPMGSVNGLKMAAIPTGRSSPFWWSNNGNSIMALYKVYAVRP